MEPISILKTGSEAVTLIAALAKLIEENKEKKPKTSLSELLTRLQIDAVRISSELENKLSSMFEKLDELGLDPEKSLESQLRDLSWYNWIRRARLKAYREDLHAAARQLTSFIDDATALILCEGNHEPTFNLRTQAFAEANALKQKLDATVMDPGRTLGGSLRELLNTARLVTERLRAC